VVDFFVVLVLDEPDAVQLLAGNLRSLEQLEPGVADVDVRDDRAAGLVPHVDSPLDDLQVELR